jgi:hypothetical protein
MILLNKNSKFSNFFQSLQSHANTLALIDFFLEMKVASLIELFMKLHFRGSKNEKGLKIINKEEPALYQPNKD